VGFFDRFRRDRPFERASAGGSGTVKIPVPGGRAPLALDDDQTPATGETLIVHQPTEQVVGVLVAVAGDLQSQAFALFDGANKLGRAASCRVLLHSPRISREHALITHNAGTFTLTALSPRNPTRLNGEPTQQAKLEDGDAIGLGETTFRFRTV
jgi:pSer/pThr/pTyr-binding forkhead associated (FHA) protein